MELHDDPADGSIVKAPAITPAPSEPTEPVVETINRLMTVGLRDSCIIGTMLFSYLGTLRFWLVFRLVRVILGGTVFNPH